MLAMSMSSFWYRNLIQKVLQCETQNQRIAQMSERVEWQFIDQNGQTVTFDPQSNLTLEDALERKASVKIKIKDQWYQAQVTERRALHAQNNEEVMLVRVDKKGESS